MKKEMTSRKAKRARFPTTVHLFFFHADRLLLLLRNNTGYMDGYYSLPAGHLDGDETTRVAGVREAYEEIGVRIDPKDLSFAGVFHRNEGDERVDFFFLVKSWSGEPINKEPSKCDELRWDAPDALPINTVPYIRKAIENFRAGILYDEYGWDME
jgi:8-oxo-dGTP diphosphatase